MSLRWPCGRHAQSVWKSFALLVAPAIAHVAEARAGKEGAGASGTNPVLSGFCCCRRGHLASNRVPTQDITFTTRDHCYLLEPHSLRACTDSESGRGQVAVTGVGCLDHHRIRQTGMLWPTTQQSHYFAVDCDISLLSDSWKRLKSLGFQSKKEVSCSRL